MLPGEVIGIADPAKGGKRFGGRILGATTTSLSIDSSFVIASGNSYQASVMLPNGVAQTRTVTNAAGTTDTLTVSPALSDTPLVGAPWVLQENSDGVRKFRVVSVTEDDGVVTVLGALYDESKFVLADTSTILGLTRTSIAGPQVVPVVAGGSIILEVPS